VTLNTQSEAKGYRVLVLISDLPSLARGENGKGMMAAALFFLYTVLYSSVLSGVKMQKCYTHAWEAFFRFSNGRILGVITAKIRESTSPIIYL
jgi:hypothetical protein